MVSITSHTLHKRLKNGGISQSLFSSILAVSDSLEQALARREITASPPRDVLIQHAVPTQAELDAISNALNITELLEQILQHLPAIDHVRACRVCRHFRLMQRHFCPLRVQMLRHFGSPQREVYERGFHFLGTIRPSEARQLAQYTELCDVQVTYPPARWIMARQTSFDGTNEWRETSKPVVVYVLSGITFDHVFGVVVDLVYDGGPLMPWFCGEDPCRYCYDNDHEVQVDVCWDNHLVTLQNRHDDVYGEKSVFDVGDGRGLEHWRSLLRWRNGYDNSGWEGGWSPPAKPE